MNSKKLSAKITLWVNRGVAVIVAALLFLLPSILEWYAGFRFLSQQTRIAITIAFYCCAAVVAVALWNMDALLRGILAGQVFVRENVWAIRRIQWCCGLVGLICLAVTFAYMPLVFLAIIMFFLCLAVSVVASVMDAAVTIREENDLTI